MADLIIGVLICSMRVDEFLEWANSPEFFKDVKRWSRKVAPAAWLHPGWMPKIGRWWRRHYVPDAREKMILFGRYVKEGSVVPKFWNESEPGGGGGGGQTTWAQAVEVALRGELGWSAEEVNESPLSKALSDYCKWLESKGAIRLMTPEEIELIENPVPPTVLIHGKPATEEQLRELLAGAGLAGEGEIEGGHDGA